MWSSRSALQSQGILSLTVLALISLSSTSVCTAQLFSFLSELSLTFCLMFTIPFLYNKRFDFYYWHDEKLMASWREVAYQKTLAIDLASLQYKIIPRVTECSKGHRVFKAWHSVPSLGDRVFKGWQGVDLSNLSCNSLNKSIYRELGPQFHTWQAFFHLERHFLFPTIEN